MTIGEVVRQLKVKYPDLTISKVRYFEDEQLIKPGRTKGGYRKFTPKDVSRLELALRLQKEKYYPIHVIRQKLNAIDRGEEVEELASSGSAPEAVEVSVAEPLSADKAIAMSGLSPEHVAQLENYGLIKSVKRGDGRVYLQSDVQLMTIAKELSQYGIEPRHLRMYANLAEREATLFQQILMPVSKQRQKESRRRAAEVMNHLCNLSDQLKSILLKRSLKESLGL
jgi:DNA-binding transcriptional MerR regulator